MGKAHVIVVGNEKGGTGKSTISMHLIVSLLRNNFSVAAIDLDGRQGTLTRYVENRLAFCAREGLSLKVPEMISVKAGDFSDALSCKRDEKCLAEEMARLSETHDVILLDTPGTDNHLFRLGHAYADTLVTPLNDSLIDLDVLAKVDPDTFKVLNASHYAERVWDVKKQRLAEGCTDFQWIVLRNRLLHHKTRNRQRMDGLLEDLSRRVGFTQHSGLGERVIFRELFLKGLTILDLKDDGLGVSLSMSHIAARQELRTLLEAIGLHQRVRRQIAS